MVEKLETLAIVARCFCLINIILTDELFVGVGLKKSFDLMLYAHDKQLRSCWDASYLTTLFLGNPHGSSLPVLSEHSFASNWRKNGHLILAN